MRGPCGNALGPHLVQPEWERLEDGNCRAPRPFEKAALFWTDDADSTNALLRIPNRPIQARCPSPDLVMLSSPGPPPGGSARRRSPDGPTSWSQKTAA